MTGSLSKCLAPTITRCHRAMETEQSCVRREVSQQDASAITTGSVDFTTSNNLSALSEKDRSPEAIVAKLFGKTESDLAMIKKSLRIAENVVLGPSMSANAIEPSTVVVEEQRDTHSSETIPPKKMILGNPNDYMNNAAAVANKLMIQTSVNIQEKDSSSTQVQKGYESKAPSQKSESENPSILSVLSNMAAEAGMEDVDTVASSNSPVVQPIPTSPKSSFPEICNDYVPVASNISFDYSIASLINNENRTSKDDEDSVMGQERVNQTSSPITKQQRDTSHGTTGSTEKPQLVSSAKEVVSSVASSYPQDMSMSNLGNNATSTVTQVSQVESSREQCGQSLSAQQPIFTTPPTMQSPSFQQQNRSPAQASQPVANSSAIMHGASISTASLSNVPQPSVIGSSAYQMPELNLPDLRELDSLSSIFSDPHMQQPHMMTWNNFNIAPPVPSPMRTHHGITTPHVSSATLSQRSPVMQNSPSPTLSHQGPFTQALQSPTLPHQGTVARPVPAPALSPHTASRAPRGGIMAAPQMPQHNVNMLSMVQDHMNTRQLNTEMSFTHSQQTALSNSISTTQNQYYGNTTQQNELAGYNTPRDLVHWQNNQANAWRGPLGIGMQGREGYGQFHEFRIRPQRQQYIAMSHGHQNIPSSVYDMNMGTQGQFPNVAMQTSASNENMNMELTRAMADIQNMQSNMNSSMYQGPQLQARRVQHPPIPQHPHTPTSVNPPQRGIPLSSFANRELRNKTRPAQQYNSARIGHAQNSIDNHSSQLPLQHNQPPVTRFQGHPQVRNPQYSQSMHSGLKRHQTPPMQNNQRPQFRSPQIPNRMPIPKQPVATPTAQLSKSRAPIHQAPRPVETSINTSSRIPTTISTTAQKSNKAATVSVPSTSSSSDLDSQSLAALVVESVLKGHDTNHVEQQIRLVNELMKGKSSTKSTASSSSTTERNISGSQGVNPSHNKRTEPSNTSSRPTPSSGRASSRSDSMSHSQTTPPPRPSSKTDLEQSSQLRKKPGRPQEMFVDLTADETAPTANPTIEKRKNPDIDIHVLIEIVNTKSQDLQFCILEKCLRNECKPKYLERCHSTHNWWVFQSEKKNICPTSEDVTSIAKKIIHRSLHDKGYFREQMTAILQSQDFKRAKIFQALCTEKIHVVGRAFQRPKAKAGLLYLNALKDFPLSGSLNMYLSATTANNIIQKVARITEEEQLRQKEPRVLVIEPIPDSAPAPTVQIEPELPPIEPNRPPLSAEERYNLENQQPIVIEPPPTPAPFTCFADEDDVAPVVIEPQVPSQSESSIIRQSQNDKQQMSNTDLLSQIPLVIAPPPTPRAPSPNKVQRKSPPAPDHAHAAQPNSSKQQDCDVMQPPSQMQVPGRKQTSSGVQGPQVSGCVPSRMPQSVLEVLNSIVPAHSQPELWQYQAQLQFNIQKQTQQKQQQAQQDQQQQSLQAHQQLLMHHQKAPSPEQIMAMRRLLYMSQGGLSNFQLPVVANISEQERPAGTQAILQGLVPKPTPFMGETPLPIVLSKNPAAPDSVAEQYVPVLMNSTLETDKPNNLPAQPQGEPRPASNKPNVTPDQLSAHLTVGTAADTMIIHACEKIKPNVTQEQLSAHLTVAPAADTMINHASEKITPRGHPQQEKLDALGDGTGVDREFSSLEDFITMSTDIGREVCASVSSSIDGDKKEAETPCNEPPKSSLHEHELPVNERDTMGKQRLSIQMKRIEDVYDSLGLKRLSRSRYRIKPTSSLMKPKRATVRRKVAVDDGILLEDSDNDPAWEGTSASENSPSSHNSSTDEYSQDEEEEEERIKTCIRIKRPLATSSDEDEVKNCDFHDSSSESPRKAVDGNDPPRRRKRRKWQIDSAINTGKSPGKESRSDTCGESPVKVQRRKRRILDSDDDSPFKKADPVFPPSPVENKSAQGSPSQPETDARSTSDVEALRKVCPSLQPSVQVARLTPGEIHKNRKKKCRRKKKKRIIKEPSKRVGNQQTDDTQAIQKSNNSSHHDSTSNTALCETVDNTKKADADCGGTPAKALQTVPLAYDLEFFTNDELWEELQRRQDLISCICGMTFVDRKHYNLHRDLHDKVNPKKCAICCEVFQDWIEFTSHTYATHNPM